MQSKIRISGDKKGGYVLSVEDKHSYQDIAINFEEIPEIIKVLSKKI